MGFSGIRIHSIGRVPRNAPFRQQLTLHLFRKLDLSGQYDFFIIAGDWAMSGAVNNKPNLWYVHSPIREIWDLYEYTRQNTVPFFGRFFFDIWVRLNRRLNRQYVSHVDRLLCNSLNTKNRLEKYLQREALVIYPPTDTCRFTSKADEGFWLSVNRMISHKRVEMQIDAFLRMPDEKLVIVGSYEQSRHFKAYAKRMTGICPHNVTILHWADQETLLDLYAKCRGFITTAKDEDFGMAPVEAMAAGKPVIAPNEGGYRETVLDGGTGILINDISADALVGAVKKLKDDAGSYQQACQTRAKQFDTAVFIKKVTDVIHDISPIQ
jgi:glycosyltransferase involved in cell wall biosynthesis